MILSNTPRWRLVVIWSSVVGLLWSGAASLQAQEISSRLSNRQSARKQPVRNRSGHQRQVKIRVRAGDTLDMIATRFGVSVDDLARLNGLTINDQPGPGQEI